MDALKTRTEYLESPVDLSRVKAQSQVWKYRTCRFRRLRFSKLLHYGQVSDGYWHPAHLLRWHCQTPHGYLNLLHAKSILQIRNLQRLVHGSIAQEDDPVHSTRPAHHHANGYIGAVADDRNLQLRQDPAGTDSPLQSFDEYYRLEAVNVLEA